MAAPHLFADRARTVATRLEHVEEHVLQPSLAADTMAVAADTHASSGGSAIKSKTKSSLTPDSWNLEALETEALIDAAVEARQTIENRYAANIGNLPAKTKFFFLDAMPYLGSEAALREKLVRALLLRDTFVIGVVGSSNSAGHDNEFNQSWPVRVEAALRPVLEVAKVDLTVRNGGIGNTKSMPQMLCLEAIAGPDVDVLVWEYAMNDASDRAYWAEWYEIWTRQALLMPRQPVPHFVAIWTALRKKADAKPDLKDEHGYPLSDAQGRWLIRSKYPPVDLHLDNSSVWYKLRHHYERFGVHQLFMQDALFYRDTLRGLTFEELFITFHPGPTGHQLMADLYAYYVLTVVQQAAESVAYLYRSLMLADEQSKLSTAALADVSAALSAMSPHELELLEKSAHRKALQMYMVPSQLDLPPKMSDACEHELCDHRSRCATTFEPHWGTDDTLLTSLMLNDTEHGWTVGQPESEKSHPERGYLDHKYALRGDAAAGALRLRLRVDETAHGVVFICQVPPIYGKRPAGWVMLNELDSVRVLVDGAAVEDAKNEQLKFSQNKDFMGMCRQIGRSVSAGDHVLEVSIVGDGHIWLSQLIVL